MDDAQTMIAGGVLDDLHRVGQNLLGPRVQLLQKFIGSRVTEPFDLGRSVRHVGRSMHHGQCHVAHRGLLDGPFQRRIGAGRTVDADDDSRIYYLAAHSAAYPLKAPLPRFDAPLPRFDARTRWRGRQEAFVPALRNQTTFHFGPAMPAHRVTTVPRTSATMLLAGRPAGGGTRPSGKTFQ